MAPAVRTDDNGKNIENKPANRNLVLLGTLIVTITTGALLAFSVFARPLSELHGWPVADVMVAYGLTTVLVPVVMILSGRLLDGGRARSLMLWGSVAFGLGHIIAGTTSSLPVLILGYGIITGIGQGLIYSASMTNSIRFFPEKRGLVAGLIAAAMGMGSMIISPLSAVLTSSLGISRALIILGVAFIVIDVSVTLFLVRSCPVADAPAPREAGATPEDTKSAPVNLTWREMIRTSRFWAILVLFICGAFFGLMILPNLVLIGEGMFGLSIAAAALYVSLFAACSAVGRIAWGWLSDRWGVINSLTVVFVLAASGFTLFAFNCGAWVLPVCVMMLAVAYGGIMSLFAPLTVENYGPRHNGMNYGIVYVAFSIGGIIAPRLGASIATAHGGDFSRAFLIAIGVSLLGLAFTFLYRTLPEPGRKISRA